MRRPVLTCLAFVAACRVGPGESCNEKVGCAEGLSCLPDPAQIGAQVCMAPEEAEATCARSEGCKQLGHCGRNALGVCAATKAEHCTRSDACTRNGQCG